MDGIKVYLSWPKNGEPFNQVDSKVIDIGYQSRVLVVECEEARSDYAALLARAEAAEKKLACAHWAEINAVDCLCMEYRECVQALQRAEAAEKERDELKDEYETRADGQRVRKDRWQTGFRNIASILGMVREEFEIHEIVEMVRGVLADNKRLREALERIANKKTFCVYPLSAAIRIDIARAALGGGE